MALIQCPDCGGDVSTQAEACPHCGVPVGTKRSLSIETERVGTQVLKGVLWVVLIIVLIVFVKAYFGGL